VPTAACILSSLSSAHQRSSFPNHNISKLKVKSLVESQQCLMNKPVRSTLHVQCSMNHSFIPNHITIQQSSRSNSP
ncbi:hypothetical protein GYMLUDRAFT_943560, partial [Collybiopsis luxurians FD-317 M1]